MLTKSFKYRNKEFMVTPVGFGQYRVDVFVWDRREDRFKEISFRSNNSMAYDYCLEGCEERKSYYRNCRAAQREFYNEYKNHKW
ncbi:MAG: hypothetical protein Q4A15_07970 [Prevotellaceae bacterium]|nr:hypothetical protein [Prevotellaceae bacterium]